ncbi:hypothetical protein BJY16_005483 [Actinoplanes octamycinicus]|uniref:NAD-dependent epimerase/dehydratase family protein n=1 Tax=Actinoplanes octamycinicus TaxID=135948 RepID=A0A7W7M9I3_9ACTN|nr:hypothetical protein [Actinoplanes octamycinicus]MBB4742024.1 hypothetical protein [Actinoplanes octamycinicus]
MNARAGTVHLGAGGVGPTAREVADVLGDGSTISITLERAREQMGPIADAFALDQRLSSARAHQDLGWRPLHDDPPAVLAGRRSKGTEDRAHCSRQDDARTGGTALSGSSAGRGR